MHFHLVDWKESKPELQKMCQQLSSEGKLLLSLLNSTTFFFMYQQKKTSSGKKEAFFAVLRISDQLFPFCADSIHHITLGTCFSSSLSLCPPLPDPASLLFYLSYLISVCLSVFLSLITEPLPLDHEGH